tara:strand:- start:564 stop:698 length:135 start_codon:yes stop_codon:yes gene_type:complete
MKISLQMIDQIGENSRRKKENQKVEPVGLFLLIGCVILTAIVRG